MCTYYNNNQNIELKQILNNKVKRLIKRKKEKTQTLKRIIFAEINSLIRKKEMNKIK